MGYEMPIVVKDVYIPLYEQSSISKEDYRKLTGIDLDDIFVYDADNYGGVVLKPLIKLWLVNMDFVYSPITENQKMVIALTKNVLNSATETLFLFGFVDEDHQVGFAIKSDNDTHEILSIDNYQI